ncbi:hypothetical protein F5Y18DRAFT_432348 [Xylariaceae sp. FL1019]|nr:hypothetical protein F5Y18DRAFT_432348 [Xylariaceae sp. FL1019]
MSVTLQDQPPEAQDEWVRVRRRKGRGKTAQHRPEPSKESSAPEPSISHLTLEQVKKDYEHFAGQWTSSPASHRLRDALSKKKYNVRIDKAICFGIGTFDPADASWDIKRKAHVQLAAFLLIVEHVQLSLNEPITCYFQDPIFNSVDKDFIDSLGHKVVASPQGFHLVDESSLVFGVHLYREIYSQVIAKHTPAMFVGTPYRVWEDFHGADNLNWDRMKHLDKQCSHINFPENPSETTFSSTAIHWVDKDNN